jgi:hypothetical protein
MRSTWSQRDTHDAQIGRSALLRAQGPKYLFHFKHRRGRRDDEVYNAYTVGLMSISAHMKDG